MRLRSTHWLSVAFAAACTGTDPDAAPTELPVLALSETPTLEIGLVAGDEAYLFQDVVSVVRLPSERIAVADGGGARVSVYGPDGTHERSFGGEGGGPGEFGRLAGLYASPEGGLTALDARNLRVSAFDESGELLGERDAWEISRDSTFMMDAWLYGRFWVDGAMADSARERVRSVLDGLPSPAAAPGFRFARAAADGRLWIREPGAAADGARTWTVLDANGRPEASVRVPAPLEPKSLDTDEVLGRWLGEADVHFVRAYDVVETAETVPVPAWLASGGAPAPADPADEEEVRELIFSAIRAMASSQEIHYSEHYTYTTDATRLERWQNERPAELEVTFVTGDRRGWSAAFGHPGFDRICALGYGFSMPAGWTPGMVVCAPPRTGEAH